MSNVSGGGREDESGRGGKMVRPRRLASMISPYARPESTAEVKSPNWLLDFVAPATRMITNSAGKLLSSVFRSDTSSSSSTGSEADDDDENNNNVVDGFAEEVEEPPHRNTSSVGTKEVGMDLQATTPKIENKLKIEQLILEETFSRDECERLTKIIKSRVVKSPSLREGDNLTPRELPRSTVRDDIPFSVTCSSRQTPFVVNRFNPYSPVSPMFQGITPGLYATTVMEAKKWLEQKKSESSTKSEQDLEPCVLNRAMMPSIHDGEVGSPVDVAKSYMSNRPPWTSPSLSGIGYRTPSPRELHLHKDASPYVIQNYSLSSSRILKRNFPTIESWDNLHRNQRPRLEQTNSTLETFELKGNDLSPRNVDENAYLLNKSNLEEIPAALDPCSISNEKSTSDVQDMKCSDVVLNLPPRDGHCAVEILKNSDEKTTDRDTSAYENQLSAISTTVMQSEIQDVDENQLRDENSNVVSVSHRLLSPDSTPLKHHGDSLEENLHVKDHAHAVQNAPLSFSSMDESVKANGNCTSSMKILSPGKKESTPSSLLCKPSSCDVLCTADVTARCQKDHIQMDARECIDDDFGTNGFISSPSSLFADANINTDLWSLVDSVVPIISNSTKLEIDNLAGSCDHTEVPIDIAHNVVKIKSEVDKQSDLISTEPTNSEDTMIEDTIPMKQDSEEGKNLHSNPSCQINIDHPTFVEGDSVSAILVQRNLSLEKEEPPMMTLSGSSITPVLGTGMQSKITVAKRGRKVGSGRPKRGGRARGQ